MSKSGSWPPTRRSVLRLCCLLGQVPLAGFDQELYSMVARTNQTYLPLAVHLYGALCTPLLPHCTVPSHRSSHDPWNEGSTLDLALPALWPLVSRYSALLSTPLRCTPLHSLHSTLLFSRAAIAHSVSCLFPSRGPLYVGHCTRTPHIREEGTRLPPLHRALLQPAVVVCLSVS